jgi:hypothetical protein
MSTLRQRRVGAVERETKPGWRTTELYAAVVLPWLVTLLQNVDVVSVTPERWRWILPLAATLASGFYANGRGNAKSGVPFVPAELEADAGYAPDAAAVQRSRQRQEGGAR